MVSMVDKVIGTDFSGQKKAGRIMDKQKAEQAKVAAGQKKEEEAIRSDELRRSAAARKVRGGTAGRRSLMTSDFKGVTGKSKTLG